MNVPAIKRLNQGVLFIWEDPPIHIRLDRFIEKSGTIHAEMTVSRVEGEGKLFRLIQAQVDLLSLRVRRESADFLKKIAPTISWWHIIEQVFVHGVDEYRLGEPALPLSDEVAIQELTYRLDPLIPESEGTVLYADGGSGKTYVGLFCALLVQQGQSLLGLTGTKGNVLYLDYEANYSVMAYRAKKLRLGHPCLKVAVPHYRRCIRPLHEDLPALERIVTEQEIQFLVVDSLALACGKELERPEAPIQLFAALRTLKVTSLLITHTPKNTEDKKAFGSVYFSNLARSVWEVRKVQEAGESTLKIGLYHRKANYGPLHKPQGFCITFGEAIEVSTYDLSEEPDLAKGLPLRIRIEQVMKSGPRTAKMLAEELDVPVTQIRPRLTEGKEQWIIPVGKDGSEILWGLKL
ncbi:MAG: AAA family ATPase [Nitrospira sp.]|nr:AAA family ATPase [Nitrospira sp.]